MIIYVGVTVVYSTLIFQIVFFVFYQFFVNTFVLLREILRKNIFVNTAGAQFDGRDSNTNLI